MSDVIASLHALIDETTRRADLTPDEIARRVSQLERAVASVRAADVDGRPSAPVVHLPTPKRVRMHLRDRVLRLLARTGQGTASEVALALGPDVLSYEIANALRDLVDRGAISRTSRRGAPISGRGRAPFVYRVNAAAARKARAS